MDATGYGNAIGQAIIAMGVLAFFAGLLLWGAWEIIDWLFIFDGIKSTEHIEPIIELTINNGRVDTLYIYEVK